MKVPPPLVRTLAVTPLAFVGSLTVTLLSPVIHLLLGIADLIDRRNWRFTRIGGLGVAFSVVELFGLVMAFILWVASGFGLWMESGPIQRAHSWVLRTWLELITRALRTFIGFEFEFPRQTPVPGPVLVLCRHAGPGDSLLVAHSVMRDHRRKLRMLGTTKLLWDPFFNHIARRLPFHFCEQNPKDSLVELAAVNRAATTIETDGAMIIFPEGGNYTPGRHHAAIDRLEARGQHARARRARQMRHVLPPRTGGTLEALRAAQEASVAFVAHVGLDDLLTLRDLWQRVPIRRTVRATYWHVGRDERPTGHTDLIDWLYGQWEKVDDWIEANSAEVFGT